MSLLRYAMISLSLSLGAAHAADSPLDYRFILWGGAFFADVDSTIQWGGEQQEGTIIGLESALDLEDNKTAFNGEFEWRFLPRHALAFRYFKLNRDGISDAPLNLIINDIVIPIETPVSSEFTNAVHALKYRFAFVNNDNLRFSGGLGLNIQDIEVTIVAEDVDVDERGEVTAPLPTLDLSLAWAITPQWILTGDVGWFELTIDDIKGQITEFRVGITWKPFRNVGFNLAYNSFEVDGDVKEEEGNFRGMLEYKFQGPMLGIVATF